MSFPIFTKRKADAISNGVFLILLGFLFYSDKWWPGILFALGLTFAIRQYLTGRKVNFLITITLIGLLGLMTLAGQTFSLFFPLLFVAAGLLLIAKECFGLKIPMNKNSSSEKDREN